MSDEIAALRNLGPSWATMLLKSGVGSHEQLRKLGAVAAYRPVKKIHPRVSLNLLWAIEGALTDRDWKTVSRDERTALLMALDDQARRDDLMEALAAADRGEFASDDEVEAIFQKFWVR